MKIFSAELSLSEAEQMSKAVVLAKDRSGYSLLSYYTTEAAKLKVLSGGMALNFCIDFYDSVFETIDVPPVKDAKTFKMLAANKLRDHTDRKAGYLMAYKRNEYLHPDHSGNAEHKVFMIPESLFEESAGLSEEQKVHSGMFTLADFAPSGITKEYFPEEVVFHAFADEKKIVLTVSRGDYILYIRSMEYNESGMSQESVFYESINLTYMYASKNLGIKIDIIVLTGLLYDKERLSSMLFEFNSVPQAVLMPDKVIKGCSREVFHKFFIPLSLSMLSDSYDFTPERYQEVRGFNILKTAANVLSIFLVIVLLYLTAQSFIELHFAKKEMESSVNFAELKAQRYSESFNDADKQKFGLYYLKQIEKYRSSAFDMYADTAGLLDTADYNNVSFSLGGGGGKLNIGGSLSFKNFRDADRVRGAAAESLEQLQMSRKYRIKDVSKYNLESLTAKIRIEIKEKQRDR